MTRSDAPIAPRAKTGVLEADAVGMVFRSGFGGRMAKVALREATLSIGGPVPSITAVVGESGSGKTTLTRLLLGFQAPTQGRVRYRGTDLTKLDGARRVAFRREVQAVFQDPFDVFNPFYRIDHALFTPLSRFGIARREDEARSLIEGALETVGLRPSETLGRYPHQLSGGQRQRVMIARALLLDPHIILADEPVSMVDASLRSTILQTLLRLKDEAGISLVYVTHDLTTAYQVADTVVVLYAGAVVEAGGVEAVIGAPKHPYTRSLIDAIPSPDLDVSWGLDAVERAERSGAGVPATGCAFAPRCPHVRPACTAGEPALLETDPGRRVRCILHPGVP
jgi:oligopeptide/dipeptide ABC transporter ATP-binding protein